MYSNFVPRFFPTKSSENIDWLGQEKFLNLEVAHEYCDEGVVLIFGLGE